MSWAIYLIGIPLTTVALVPRFRFATTSHLESVVGHAHEYTAPLARGRAGNSALHWGQSVDGLDVRDGGQAAYSAILSALHTAERDIGSGTGISRETAISVDARGYA